MTDHFLLDLIAQSPFRPLIEHAGKVKLTVLKMDEAVHAYIEGDKAKVEALYKDIDELEHEADEVKHAIRDRLPSTLIMPVDRADIISLLKEQDDVANSAERVAELLDMKALEMPPDVKNIILKLEREVLLTVEEHVDAASKIIALLDSAFSDKQRMEIHDIINRVDRQKHNVDVIRLEAEKTIYRHENELSPISVYRLIELVNELGWVAGYAENASERLRLIVAKR